MCVTRCFPFFSSSFYVTSFFLFTAYFFSTLREYANRIDIDIDRENVQTHTHTYTHAHKKKSDDNNAVTVNNSLTSYYTTQRFGIQLL